MRYWLIFLIVVGDFFCTFFNLFLAAKDYVNDHPIGAMFDLGLASFGVAAGLYAALEATIRDNKCS